MSVPENYGDAKLAKTVPPPGRERGTAGMQAMAESYKTTLLDMNTGREFSDAILNMKNVKVTVLSLRLRCDVCGQEWSPKIPGLGKRFSRGYWKCPKGCNAQKV